MAYEMYNPMVAILVAAENATELPRLGNPNMKLRVQASQTVRTGDFRFASTLWKNLWPGIPPSRAKAYIIREFEVTEKVPQKNMAPINIVMRTIAPFSPTVSKNICATGCPVAELIVPSKSCMENSKPKIRNQPRTADTPMDITIPMEPAMAAL